MQRSEYFNISRLENDHWWYKANREFSLRLLNRYLPAKSNLNILDIGCGTGGTTVSLKKFGNVTGIDFNPVAIKLAKKYNINQLFLANVNRLRFKNNSFDLVTSFDVLYHQKVNIAQSLLEVFRVLRPGGYFLIRVPAYKFLFGGHDKVVHTAYRFNNREMEQLLKTNGFKIKRSTYFNWSLFFPALFWRTVINNHAKSDIVPVWRSLNFFLYILIKIESYLATYINFPWGTSVYSLATKPSLKRI